MPVSDQSAMRRLLYILALLPALLFGGCASTLSADEAATVAGKTYVVTGASSGFGAAASPCAWARCTPTWCWPRAAPRC
ncbi:hypothetical protein [Massilia sp. Se16.2.3]|uniref:hypothetical protein n=1 Tax=Massilia sp. Se16.2.3 TaxID=2709303 RepID=UPI00191F0C29|nr:hypothetical protein [Massilia sp. Se16.2.3]